jgi:hypothetical protein
MDTPESITIEPTTDAVVVAGVGASTFTSTAAVPGASAPKIGTVSKVITRYFLPVPSRCSQLHHGEGDPANAVKREGRWSTLGWRSVQVR